MKWAIGALLRRTAQPRRLMVWQTACSPGDSWWDQLQHADPRETLLFATKDDATAWLVARKLEELEEEDEDPELEDAFPVPFDDGQMCDVPEARRSDPPGSTDSPGDPDRRAADKVLRYERGRRLAKAIGETLREVGKARRGSLCYAIQTKIGGKCWRITADPTLDMDSTIAKNWRGVERNGPILTFDTREEAEQWLILYRLRNDTHRGKVLPIPRTMARG